MVGNPFHAFLYLKTPWVKRGSSASLAIRLQPDLDCSNSFTVIITYIV